MQNTRSLLRGDCETKAIVILRRERIAHVRLSARARHPHHLRTCRRSSKASTLFEVANRARVVAGQTGTQLDVCPTSVGRLNPKLWVRVVVAGAANLNIRKDSVLDAHAHFCAVTRTSGVIDFNFNRLGFRSAFQIPFSDDDIICARSELKLHDWMYIARATFKNLCVIYLSSPLAIGSGRHAADCPRTATPLVKDSEV